jgi:hypothetical protein
MQPGGCGASRGAHNKRHQKIARKRAKKIMEIRPGVVTVYTAYLVVLVRLVILMVRTVVPGMQ